MSTPNACTTRYTAKRAVDGTVVSYEGSVVDPVRVPSTMVVAIFAKPKDLEGETAADGERDSASIATPPAAAAVDVVTQDLPPMPDLYCSDRFGSALLECVCICHDVVLEETIALRRGLRALLPPRKGDGSVDGGADADPLAAVFDGLDRLLPMRPIRHGAGLPAVKWREFVRGNGAS
jgi:hypothetical protein